jgi:hypothetical protein
MAYIRSESWYDYCKCFYSLPSPAQQVDNLDSLLEISISSQVSRCVRRNSAALHVLGVTAKALLVVVGPNRITTVGHSEIVIDK